MFKSMSVNRRRRMNVNTRLFFCVKAMICITHIAVNTARAPA